MIRFEVGVPITGTQNATLTNIQLCQRCSWLRIVSARLRNACDTVIPFEYSLNVSKTRMKKLTNNIVILFDNLQSAKTLKLLN